MIRKQYVWIGFMSIFLIALTVKVSIAVNRDFNKIATVRMGCIADFHEAYGVGAINAVKMAAEEINAAGGILGKKVEVIYYDAEGKPEKAVSVFKKAVLDDKVDVIIGPQASGTTLAVQSHLSKYNIVGFCSSSSLITLTENVIKDYERNKYFFRHMVNNVRMKDATFKFLTEFVHGKLGYNKIAILSENAKWTQNFAPVLKDELDQSGIGMKVVYFEMFDVDIKDFAPVFAKIKSSGAQWIAQIVAHASSMPMVKAWAESQGPPMGAYDSQSMDSKFWEETNGKCLGQVTPNFILRAPLTEKTIPFWDKYVKMFKTNPVFTSPFSYDAVYMLAQVIKEKKSVKTDDLIAGLENLKYYGVLHPETAFDKKSHDLMEGRFVYPFVQWQDGKKQVVIYPEKNKTGEYVPLPWYKK